MARGVQGWCRISRATSEAAGTGGILTQLTVVAGSDGLWAGERTGQLNMNLKHLWSRELLARWPEKPA